MCGIAGFCNGGADSENLIRSMTNRIKHRGPDSDGAWFDDNNSVVLGHRRLAIIDVSPTGAQPMISHSGNMVIAYNGEIYNHRELVNRIKQQGVSFKGTSDTEVLLESFDLFGIDDTLKNIKGMFAIALYDKANKALYLVRDRAGEKPLYYGFLDGRFFFASDLACFMETGKDCLQIDYSATELFFRRGYIPAPYSIFKGVSKLQPGHYLRISAPFADVEDYTYWSADDYYLQMQSENKRFKGSLEEAADELETLLRKSIRQQMISDVPLGAFLSAGIDSSTVVSLMQQESDRPVRTFTIGVDTPDYNEAPIAAETAKLLGTDHTEKYITVAEMKAVIPKISEIYTEPFADSSQIPTSLISRIARQDVTVVLSGDGGDELFCGYGRYNGWVLNSWKKQQRISLPVQHLRGKMLKLLGYDRNNPRIKQFMSSSISELYAAVSANDTSFIRQNVLYKDYYELSNNKDGLADQDILMLMDFGMYLPDDILAKVDRAAMDCSLETRIPFLDKDVIEFAWSLPLDMKYRDGVTKRVLRNILYKYVPQELMERPKTGFSIPLHLWLKDGELREWAESLICPKVLGKIDILDSEIIIKMWNNYIEKGIWNESIWYMLVYLDWINAYG